MWRLAEAAVNVRPRKLLRVRYSLRALLIATTLLSLGLSWYVSRARDERRAAEAVAAAGGTVTYDWQMRPENAPENYQPDPPGPNWLRSCFGPHWFDSIAKVELNGNRLRNGKNQFKLVGPHLLRLPSLRELRLWLVELDHADYETLGRMSRLKALSIGQVAEMTPQDGAALAAARGLQELRLDYAKVSPQSLLALAKLPKLEELDIDCDSYDGKTGKRIDQFDLDDESAAAVGTFRRLKKLVLHHTQITDRGMKEICKLRDLELLVVSSHRVTSASFEYVAELRRLRHLGTWVWKIDDADFEKLGPMRQLTSLGLVTPLTDESVVQLCELRQIKRLMLDGEKITDVSLPHLRQLPELEWLFMRDTSVDKLSAASKEFVQALPNCAIVLPLTAREKELERSFHAQRDRW